MNARQKSWAWFLLLMVLILGVGIYLGTSRRNELGTSFDYSLEEYREVDSALIHYIELDPIVPAVEGLSALAIGEDGTVYVSGENVVQAIGGERIAVDGIPTCMAVDDAGTLLIGMQDHVLSVSREGSRIAWSSPSGKAFLTSIVVDKRYVFVADAGSRRVWRYNKSGGEPFEIGKKDAANGVRGFYIPSPFFDLDLGPDGSLWVVNPGHHALENYRADGMPISAWERSAFTIDGFSGCCNPSHFALMPDGAFVTAEKGLPRIKIHNVDGSLRCVVAAPAQFDDDVTGLDVAVDSDGLIYVLDRSRQLIRIFEEKK